MTVAHRLARIALILSLPLWAMAQPADSLPVTDLNTTEGMNHLRRAQLNPHALVYEKATQLGDWPTAIVSLQHLLLDQPDNPFLQDSLAALYFRVGNLPACLRWSKEQLASRPNAVFLLEMTGNVEEAQGNPKAALEHYERLLALTPGYYFRYKVASLQYQLGRYGESGSHVASMLTDAGMDEEVIHIDWGDGGGDIPLRSALLNLRGNLELALNKETLARKSFKEAVKLAPAFVLARNNLNALQAKHEAAHDHGGR